MTTCPTAPGHSRRFSWIRSRRFLHVVIICLLGLIVYSNTFQVPFQWDEGTFIKGNPVVRDFSYFVHPSYAPKQFYGALAERYIGFLTFALNYKINGFNVTGYHIFNLAVHIFNAVLVYLLVVLTFRTPYFRKRLSVPGLAQKAERLDRSGLRSGDFIAFIAALLFVCHPVQIEAVTYIFQRLASLAAMFYLLSMVFYIKGRLGHPSSQVDGLTSGKQKEEACKPASFRAEERNSQSMTDDEGTGIRQTGSLPQTSNLKPQTRRRWPVVWLILSFLSAVLAMKTKENTFTLPIMIILYEFLFFEGTRRTRAFFLIPISLTLLIIPVTLLLTGGNAPNPYDPSSMTFRHIPRWDYFITQGRVLTTYMRLFFLPFNQDIDYDYPVFHSLLNPEVFLSAFFLFLLFGLAVYLLYRSKGRSAKDPAQQAGKQQETSGKKQAEDSTPPSSPLNLRHNPPLSPLDLRGDEGGLCFSESQGPGLLADSSPRYTLFSMPFASYYRLIGFGILWFFITLLVESSLQPIPQVIDEYRMYLPMAGMALASTAGLVLLAGKFGRRKAGLAVILMTLIVTVFLSAASYGRNSVWETKVSLWKDAAAKSPGKATVHLNLGSAYAEQNQLDKAITQYELAVRLDPYYAEPYYDLCKAYSKKDRPDMAIYYCRTAAVLYPGNADVHYYFGLMYLRKGFINDARSEIETALRLKPGLHMAKELLYEINKGER